MGIKHPLHRKKLVLAIKSISTKQDEKSAQLDHIWVTRKCWKNSSENLVFLLYSEVGIKLKYFQINHQMNFSLNR